MIAQLFRRRLVRGKAFGALGLACTLSACLTPPPPSAQPLLMASASPSASAGAPTQRLATASVGVVQSSGVLDFDIGALLSIHRAAPLGLVPIEFLSPDGNAYVHWEFYRNPDFACSTYFAHPFLLKAAPTNADVPLPVQVEEKH